MDWKGETEMKRRTLVDRLVTLGLALVLVAVAWAAYQMGSRSGASSANNEALAAPAAAQSGTGYISVPAAAFVPTHYLVDYTNGGHWLYLNTLSVDGDEFYAPLHLPHGATVTKLTLSYYDDGSGAFDYVDIGMELAQGFGAGMTMAYVRSDDGGTGSKSTTSILNPLVDNSQYSYFLSLSMQNTGAWLKFYEALIEFTYPTTHLPLTLSGY